MSMLTIAESRVDELHEALTELVEVIGTRLPAIERELAAIKETVHGAAGAIFDATLYDPEGVCEDE